MAKFDHKYRKVLIIHFKTIVSDLHLTISYLTLLWVLYAGFIYSPPVSSWTDDGMPYVSGE